MYEHDFNPALSKQFNFGVLCGPAMSYTSGLRSRPHRAAVHTWHGGYADRECGANRAADRRDPWSRRGHNQDFGTITYSAFDHQSGLTRVEAVLGNDDVVATRDLTPRRPDYDFTVCPSVDDGSLSVDTSSVPNGSHRLTVRVS